MLSKTFVQNLVGLVGVVRTGVVAIRRSTAGRLFLLIAGVLALGCGAAQAQIDSPYLYMPAPPSYSTPSPTENGYVEQTSGHLHLEFPLGEPLPQRGGKVDQPKLIYDSNVWGPVFVGIGNQGLMIPDMVSGGWSTTPVDPMITGGSNIHTSFKDSGGNIHSFPTVVGGGNAFASDSSGYYMVGSVSFPATSSTGLQIYAPDGSVAYSGGWAGPEWGSTFTGISPNSIDPNGNYEGYCNPQTTNATCDTLGRATFSRSHTITGSGSPPALTDYVDTYSFPNSAGGTSQYTVTFVQITVGSNFGITGWSDCSGCTMNVVKSIGLPDGSSYGFMYDCDPSSSTHPEVCSSPDGQFYGEVTKMTLPGGGTVNYQYQVFHDVYGAPSRWISQRSSGASGTTTYAPAVVSSCAAGNVGCQQTLTVTNQAGLATTTTFTVDKGSWPVQVQTLDTTTTPATVISTTTATYDMSHPCVENQCVGHDYIRKTQEVTALGSQSLYYQTETQYQYDTYQDGLVSAVLEWGYVSSGSVPDVGHAPTRTTYTQYYSPGSAPVSGTPVALGGTNIHRPSQVTVCGGSGSDPDCPGGGAKLQQTKYSYDEAAPASITGIVNHADTNYGVGLVVRGNPTTIQRWIQGSQYATTHYTYDMTGQVTSMTDPRSNTTSYSYTDSFLTDNNATSSSPYTPSAPTNAYPTTVTSPPVNGAYLITNTSYYFGDGKVAYVKDPNHAESFYHYDNAGRTLAVESPTGWGENIYTSPTEVNTYTAVADTSPSTACGSCQHQQLLFDSYGRPTSKLMVNAPGGATGVDTGYDSLGRVNSVSHPYGPLNPTKVYETYAYDIQNRVTQVTHPDGNAVQTSYVNLGFSQMGSLGALGLHQRVVDEAGKGLDYWYNASGQLLEVDEPWVSSGTTYTAYVYLFGGQQSIDIDPCAPYEWDGSMMPCPQTIYDSGGVYVTINGHSVGVGYGAYITDPDMYWQLVNTINSSNLGVNASYDPSNGLVLVSAANFSLSTSSYSSDPTDFPTPAYQASYSGPSASSNGGGTSGSMVGTFYTYDPLGRLTQTTQDSQIRSFSYDGLGNVLSESNPEMSDSSTPTPHECPVTYTYDLNSNLYSRTRPAPNQTSCTTTVTTTYGAYDAWNRSPGRSYSDGEPAITFTYDQGGISAHALGLLTAMSDASGAETYQHDVAERVNQTQKTVGGTTYITSFLFNLNGSPNQITYPSGRVVTPSYDNIGRLIQISSNGTNFLTITPSTGFDASGHVLQQTYGNGVVGNFSYSPDRSQLATLSYTSGGNTLFALNYGYKSADCYATTTGMTAADNGMIQCIHDVTGSQQAGRSALYTYDALGRLQGASTAGSTLYPQWGLSWNYDRFGNRLSQAVTAGSGYGPVTPADPLTNRLSGVNYDAVGNPTNNGTALTWDGESHLLGYGSGATYTYDGGGSRVVKNHTGSQTVYVAANGAVLDEYDSGATVSLPTREYIYAGSVKIAEITQAGISYYHRDHLSTRLITTNTSTYPATREQGHFPFGELLYQSGAIDKFIFTGKERDIESGNDYFEARYYGSGSGRFLSPDPSGLSLASSGNPQSLNLYSYGMNNPIGNVDPTGLECVWDDGSYDSEDDSDTGSPGKCQGQGGTWIELGQNGNWSPSGNGNYQQAVANIQSGRWGAVGVQGLDGTMNYTWYHKGLVSVTDTGGLMTQYQYLGTFVGDATVWDPSSASVFATQPDPGGKLGAGYFSRTVFTPLDPNDPSQRVQDLANDVDFTARHPFGKDLAESCAGYLELQGYILTALTGGATYDAFIARAGYQSAAAASAGRIAAGYTAGATAAGLLGPACKVAFEVKP